MTIKPQEKPKAFEPVQCWAHTRKNGTRCKNIVTSREGEPIPIPYCALHLKCGDGALRIVPHPVLGKGEKCLVARHDLPKNYRMAFHGVRGRCKTSDKEDRAISFYPPDKTTGKNYDSNRNRICKYNGVLNPADSGDIMQFAACPGPDERQNLKSTFSYYGLRNGILGGLEFITLEKIPKSSQLCHWYGPGWWSARGIKRMNVGTDKYPAPKRSKRQAK